MSVYVTGTGQRITVHDFFECDQQFPCPVHRPSDHDMRAFPTNWRGDRDLLERVCPHEVGHPDPDALAFYVRAHGTLAAQTASIHGCDGCCQPSERDPRVEEECQPPWTEDQEACVRAQANAWDPREPAWSNAAMLAALATVALLRNREATRVEEERRWIADALFQFPGDPKTLADVVDWLRGAQWAWKFPSRPSPLTSRVVSEPRATAKEREACAKVAEAFGALETKTSVVSTGRLWSAHTARNIAAAIRGRARSKMNA